MKRLRFGWVAVLATATVTLASCVIATPTVEPTDDGAMMMPVADGTALFTYINDTAPYTGWGTWPTDMYNDFSGLLISGAPHGGVVRIFVNDVALDAADNFTGELPEGSIIVKENYMGSSVDDPGVLDALTIMYKVKGFNPDGGDWFWAKIAPNGTVDAEGAVGMCIGCHAQPNNKDYVLRYGFGGEPAVSSLSE